jgi:hypothetical protein
MKLTRKGNNQKGETNMYYVVMGIVIALVIVVMVKYFHDHNNDITIHPPVINVH